MILERFSGWSRRRKVLTLGAAAVVTVVVAVVLVWLLVWRGDAPPPPSVLERSQALTATTAAPPVPEPAPTAEPPPAAEPPPPAGDPGEPPPAAAEPPAPALGPAEPPAAAEPPPPPAGAAAPPAPPPGPYPEPEPQPPEPAAPAPAPAGSSTAEPESTGAVNLDGVWSVDTTLGSFEDYSSSWAGYRVGEELSGIGTTEAVGRTPAVSGTLEVVGLTAVAAGVDVDLTTLVSDRPPRDGLVRGALNTGEFPLARFELTAPVTFAALPTPTEEASQVVDGEFTVHGVTRPVRVLLTAAWIEDVIIVGGSFEIRFEDYGIDPPRAPVVLSVEDTGTVELLLNFTR